LSARGRGSNCQAGRMKVLEEKNESVPQVEPGRCTGCGRCVAACPERLFTLEVSGFRKCAVLEEPQRCSRCGKCVTACLVGALVQAPE
jgi:formate hydrogenlyase subunit 6/NADH:ubiquinone oxidoreductase subunit I